MPRQLSPPPKVSNLKRTPGRDFRMANSGIMQSKRDTNIQYFSDKNTVFTLLICNTFWLDLEIRGVDQARAMKFWASFSLDLSEDFADSKLSG